MKLFVCIFLVMSSFVGADRIVEYAQPPSGTVCMMPPWKGRVTPAYIESERVRRHVRIISEITRLDDGSLVGENLLDATAQVWAVMDPSYPDRLAKIGVSLEHIEFACGDDHTVSGASFLSGPVQWWYNRALSGAMGQPWYLIVRSDGSLEIDSKSFSGKEEEDEICVAAIGGLVSSVQMAFNGVDILPAMKLRYAHVDPIDMDFTIVSVNPEHLIAEYVGAEGRCDVSRQGRAEWDLRNALFCQMEQVQDYVGDYKGEEVQIHWDLKLESN